MKHNSENIVHWCWTLLPDDPMPATHRVVGYVVHPKWGPVRVIAPKPNKFKKFRR